MTPFEQAREVYAREACARTFEQDLLLHHLRGFVFSTPVFFIMGRPVRRDADPALIVNPAHSFDRNEANCWHIYLMAGDTREAWGIMPWALGWFSFERRNELRFYPCERIRRLSLGTIDQCHEDHDPSFSVSRFRV